MKALLISCFCFCGLLSVAQPKESFYALDSNWQQTEEKLAKYLLWIHQDSAGDWAYSYYHMWGPMIKMQTYKDHEGTILNGLSCYYYTTGNLDSVGHYKDGKKDGIFLRYQFLPKDTLRLTARYDYVLDSLTGITDYRHDASATGEPDMRTAQTAEYPEGDGSWQFFLKNHLQYPGRAVGHKSQGVIRIAFTVDDQGNVFEPMVSKSVEYSLDREALRVIEISGKWKPGLNHGVPASTVQTYPVVFRLE